MSQNEMKKAAAEAALEYIKAGDMVGVGTGSTVNFFIDALATIKHKIDGAVSSSEASTERLKSHGIPVYDLNETVGHEAYGQGQLVDNRPVSLFRNQIKTWAATDIENERNESKNRR